MLAAAAVCKISFKTAPFVKKRIAKFHTRVNFKSAISVSSASQQRHRQRERQLTVSLSHNERKNPETAILGKGVSSELRLEAGDTRLGHEARGAGGEGGSSSRNSVGRAAPTIC